MFMRNIVEDNYLWFFFQKRDSAVLFPGRSSGHESRARPESVQPRPAQHSLVHCRSTGTIFGSVTIYGEMLFDYS